MPKTYAALMAAPHGAASAEQLRAYRAHHGLTQQQLADILGKTTRAVKMHEGDPTKPLPANEWLLLRLLGGEVTPAQARADTLYPTRQKRRRTPK